MNNSSDYISRQQAIERLKLNFPTSQGADNSRDRHRYMQALADIQAIRELPSVTPQLSSELEKNSKLEKIKAEIERQEKWLMDAGYNQYNVDIALDTMKSVVDKCKAESVSHE